MGLDTLTERTDDIPHICNYNCNLIVLYTTDYVMKIKCYTSSLPATSLIIKLLIINL